MQVVINGFGNKIAGNLIIDIDIIRKLSVNIESLPSVLPEFYRILYMLRKNSTTEFKERLLLDIIQNFIKVIKEKHDIDVIYGKDFLINLELPTIENHYESSVTTIIIITDKGNKITGQLKYNKIVQCDLMLSSDLNLLLPPITITLPKKIKDQHVHIINKSELEKIINPIVKSKLEMELYKILRLKPILNYHYYI